MTKTETFITGWDIGGAHLKVARCNKQGKLIEVLQLPCPLWKGIEHLQHAIQTVQQKLDNQNDIAAITMTGELADIFPDRKTGVATILNCLGGFIPEHQRYVYAGEQGWLSPSKAKQSWLDVASRNWQASANFAASKVPDGLFIDIGSTTCDIIPLLQGKAFPTGYTDQERQISRELLYTGTIRTPLIALTNMAPFNGELVSLAAEVFAITGDVWCLLGQLHPDNIQDPSADGKPWEKIDCARRLARLVGADISESDISPWQQLAQWFAQQQLHHITNACLHVLSTQPHLNNQPVIGAGIGRFIIQQCAQQLCREYIDFDSLISPSSKSAADHAPAVAVALLASQQLT